MDLFGLGATFFSTVFREANFDNALFITKETHIKNKLK